MTAGQSAHSQTQVWFSGRIAVAAAFAAGVVLTIALVVAVVLSGAFAATTHTPAPGAPAYHLNNGTLPAADPGTIRFQAHAE